MTEVTAVLFALAASLATAVAQLFLKVAACRYPGRGALGMWLSAPGVAAGAGLARGTLLNLAAYRVLPLKFAVALHPLQIAFVVGGSRLFLGERIDRPAVAGLTLVTAGVAVFLSAG